MFPGQKLILCVSVVLAAQIGFSQSTQYVQWPRYAETKTGEAITPYWEGETRSMLSCYAMCTQFLRCQTAAFSILDQVCFLYETAPDDYDDKSPLILMPNILHFKKVGNNATERPVPDSGLCEHGAVKHNETHCQCVGGYIGQYCDQVMQDCSEGFESEFYQGVDGVFIIQPTIANQPFQVRCIMENGGYTVIQTNTIADIINFNRTWQEYVDGFGELMGSHWLGLDKMHNITFGRTQTALFFVKLAGDENFYVREYLGFTVETNSAMNYDYSMAAAGYFDVGDSLTPSKGQLFTTYDMDNDKSTASNCAVRYGAGFWFNDCANCNPNGVIDGVTTPSEPYRIHWTNDMAWELITIFEIRLRRY